MTKIKFIAIILATLCLFAQKLQAMSDSDNIQAANTATATLKTNAFTEPYSLLYNNPDYKRMAINFGMFVGYSALFFAVALNLPKDFTNWYDVPKINQLGTYWVRHIKSPPVWDKDDFFLNYISHPYAGAAYYVGARGSGLNVPYSFLYTVAVSTFAFEYGMEAFLETPSIQDLIVTPLVGSIFGEGFYLAKRAVVANNYEIFGSKILGYTAAFLLDPFNELADWMGGGHYVRDNKITLYAAPKTMGIVVRF